MRCSRTDVIAREYAEPPEQEGRIGGTLPSPKNLLERVDRQCKTTMLSVAIETIPILRKCYSRKVRDVQEFQRDIEELRSLKRSMLATKPVEIATSKHTESLHACSD